MTEIDLESCIQHLQDAKWAINERKFEAAKKHIGAVVAELKVELEDIQGPDGTQICVICGEVYPEGSKCSRKEHDFVRGLT